MYAQAGLELKHLRLQVEQLTVVFGGTRSNGRHSNGNRSVTRGHTHRRLRERKGSVHVTT